MNTDNSVSIVISVDEWRDITTWAPISLELTEHSPFGHLLLECEGTQRTWVIGDGEQFTVIHAEGQEPRGVANPNERLTVLVNARLFRRRTPQDATLTITERDDTRYQTLATDEVEMTLPEHPGDFGDWRAVVEAASGAPFAVETSTLREACAAASVVPFGLASGDVVHAWVAVRAGRLHFETPWADYPATKIELPLVTDAVDTVPTLVDTGRLLALLHAIDDDRCSLLLPVQPRSPVGLRAGRFEALLAYVDRWGRERRRLEELMCEFLGVSSVEADHDGDYPVTTPEGHGLWVRLNTDAEPICVQVFSVLATSVEPSSGLFEELNSINAAATHVKVIWAANAVMAEVDLVAEALDLAELSNALHTVRRTAENYRDVLSAYYGSSGDPDAETS